MRHAYAGSYSINFIRDTTAIDGNRSRQVQVGLKSIEIVEAMIVCRVIAADRCLSNMAHSMHEFA
jgi:hypothetical protein